MNNAIALAITISVHRSRRAVALAEKAGCSFMRTDAAFGALAVLFALSIAHNILNVMRFHRIRREVFGESMCAARRRWRQHGEIALDDESRKATMLKFKEMGKRMPNLFISAADVVLATGFLGLWILTTLIAKKEQKVELGVAYSSIGALVASVLNLIIGVNGVKFWARQRKREAEPEIEDAQDLDAKEKLLDN